MKIVILLFLAFVLVSVPAAARMYQWVDPDTGTIQLSGKPPPWYRSGQPGPQVFVFDHGRVVDDTAIQVSDSERLRLRQEAYLRVEQDRQELLEKMQEAQRMKATLDRGKGETEAAAIADDIPVVAPSRAATEAQADRAAGPTVEEMRALIEQWEQLQSQNARQLIEGASQ